MIDQIEQSEKFDVSSKEIGPISPSVGDAAKAFTRIEKRKNIHLSPALHRCFLRFSTLALYWRSPTQTQIAGEFYLPRITKALLGGPPKSLEGATREERDLYSQFRVIDFHPNGGTGTLGLIRLQPETPSPEVWFHDMNRGSYKLDIDYCGYLDALLMTRGYYAWQYLFADVSFRDNEFVRVAENTRRSIDLLSSALPGTDYGPLEDRLAHRLA